MCKIISPQVFDRSRARAGGSAAAPLLVLSPCFTDLGNLGRSIFAQAKHLSPFELAAVSFCSRPDTLMKIACEKSSAAYDACQSV
jgi:hypothetical protein